MRIGISTNGDTVDSYRKVLTPQDFEEGIKTIKQLADELSQGQKIEGVAGGVAVIFDKTKSLILHSPHLPNWINKPLKTELENMFGTAVFLDNETAIAGLGEATKGAGVGKNIVAYLPIGTGVGGVRIVSGKIDENCLGFEPGHQIIVMDGDPCTCGGKGHLETYVGGYYIEKKYGKKGEDIKDPQVWDEISKYLAVGLTNTIVHWSPDIVVLGGGVIKSISLDTVNLYLKEFLTIFPTPPEITQSTLGDQSGLIGALQLLASSF